MAAGNNTGGEEWAVTEALPADVLANLARIVLAEETLDSVLSKVAHLARQVIASADEVSLTLVRRGRADTAAYTGEMAMQADERQYGLDTGPCLDAARGGELLHIPDMGVEERWPEYAPMAVRVGVFSSLHPPAHPGRPDRRTEHLFPLAACLRGRRRRGRPGLRSYAAIAVSNADTFASTAEIAEQLRVAMASRAAIEQAKGIIMAHGGISPDEAFIMLVRASQRENRKLRDVATDVVKRAQERPPRG